MSRYTIVNKYKYCIIKMDLREKPKMLLYNIKVCKKLMLTNNLLFILKPKQISIQTFKIHNITVNLFKKVLFATTARTIYAIVRSNQLVQMNNENKYVCVVS